MRRLGACLTCGKLFIRKRRYHLYCSQRCWVEERRRQREAGKQCLREADRP